jgi:diguanylate cyclase (GGDEF)-like protein/PAS domain S-box-containing protein
MAAVILAASELGGQVLRDRALPAGAWWPSAGVALAVLGRTPRRLWPALLTGLMLGNAVTNVHLGSSASTIAAFAAANAIECLITALVLQGRTRRAALLATPRDGARLVVGAALGVAAASGVVAVRCLADGAAWWPVASGYALSHGLGLVILTPLLVIPVRGIRVELADTARNAEWCAQLAATVAVTYWVFVSADTAAWPFLVFLPLLWGAARLGPLRALLSVVAMAVLATNETLHGAGPFGALADPQHRQWLLQALLAATCLVTLVLVLAAQSRAAALQAVLAREQALLQAQTRLADSERLFRLAFDGASVGMYLVSLAPGSVGRLLQVNDAMCTLLGYSEPELLRQDVWSISDEQDHAAVQSTLATLLAGADTAVQREKRYLRSDGGHVWANLSVSSVYPQNGEPYAVACADDLTARKAAEAALTFLALHDSLTGLPNRALVLDRIAHAVSAAQRSRQPLGLLYLDLDGFKAVNDTAGHRAGDELLVEIARRLEATVRPGDTVARLGGDEFVVVCTEIAGQRQLAAIAERVLAALRVPVVLAAGTFRISASIGLAVGDGTDDADRLLAVADTAMYTAKRSGKDRLGSATVGSLLVR